MHINEVLGIVDMMLKWDKEDWEDEQARRFDRRERLQDLKSRLKKQMNIELEQMYLEEQLRVKEAK